MNIYLIGAVVAVGIWGTTGVVKGVKWTWHNKGCIVHHGVKYCKAQSKGAQK